MQHDPRLRRARGAAGRRAHLPVLLLAQPLLRLLDELFGARRRCCHGRACGGARSAGRGSRTGLRHDTLVTHRADRTPCQFWASGISGSDRWPLQHVQQPRLCVFRRARLQQPCTQRRQTRRKRQRNQPRCGQPYLTARPCPQVRRAAPPAARAGRPRREVAELPALCILHRHSAQQRAP